MTGRQELAAFDGISRVVADPLRFKLKLAIGEEAYASLRLKKHIGNAWDAGGAAATGAGIAATPMVASTFFASSAGMLGWLGIGAAATTPVGWIVAAALASGGAYYGVVQLARKYAGSRVQTIPKFINTPLDLLGASLLDLIGGLAAKLAWIDGQVVPAEKEAIAAHFVGDWGLDADYVAQALDLLVVEANEQRVTQMSAAVARFVHENPDCNAGVLRAQILAFLKDVAEADGVMDEREELALDAISRIFATETAVTLSSVRNQVSNALSSTASAIGTKLGRGKPG